MDLAAEEGLNFHNTIAKMPTLWKHRHHSDCYSHKLVALAVAAAAVAVARTSVVAVQAVAAVEGEEEPDIELEQGGYTPQEVERSLVEEKVFDTWQVVAA